MTALLLFVLVMGPVIVADDDGDEGVDVDVDIDTVYLDKQTTI
jgi:hypothetical protein